MTEVSDHKGRPIEVGSLVSYGDDEAGVVRAITEGEGLAPTVIVEWEDGEDEAYQAVDHRNWYTDPADLRVEGLEVLPS